MKSDILPALGLWIIFEAVAVGLWTATGHIFFLLNFSYIGTCLSLGIFFTLKRFTYARNVIQFGIGLYMLVLLGIVGHENMQIEGFWYYLFLGVFEAAVIHYAVAKIFGPLLFGRGWCGYACWTAMVLDVLPYKTPAHQRKRGAGWIRLAVFAASFVFVGGLFVFAVPNLPAVMFASFIIGNILYYAVGILLAFVLKDNRAFCKYVCPVTVFLKPMSFFSLLRVKVDTEKCVSCGKCLRVCPMDVDVMNPSRKRKNGTECILCMKCIEACPKKALKL